MLTWGRIRAGAHDGVAVELFRLPVVRFVEKINSDEQKKDAKMKVTAKQNREQLGTLAAKGGN
jgi:hypothetical protein